MNKLYFILLAFTAILFSSCDNKNVLSRYDIRFSKLEDGTRIAYKTLGEGNNTLVFIHGFGCDMNLWAEQANYFRKTSKTVFIDLPGYGHSDKPATEYTLDYFAEAVKVVLDSLQLNHAVLIGHSLGTAICRQIAFSYPDLISKMVDVDGVYCFYPEDSLLRAENEKQYAKFVALFNAKDLKNILLEFVEPLFAQSTPESVRSYAKIMIHTPQYVAYSTMANIVSPENWTEATIEIPTLVYASKHSQIPSNYREIMGKLYPNMEYHELDSIGHFIMMEDPEMFNNTLEHFINE